MSKKSRTILALNSSTQSTTGIVIDPTSGRVLWSDRINFGATLGAKYGVGDGFIEAGGGIVYSPPLMWVEAVELLLDKLAAALGPAGMKQIGAVSGAGQQHGTAYLRAGARTKLRDANPSVPLHEQLYEGFFSYDRSPIWRDSSTGAQCRLLEERIGRERIAELTGSVPTERFSFPQILRIATDHPEVYEQTEHICLVSSLICGLFLGDIAPMEPGDGSGMNLMSITTGKWEPSILAAFEDIAPGLLQKLPAIIPSTAIAGTIGSFMRQRYGFADDVQILPFSGDNPDSLLGMGIYGKASETDPKLVLSLGTSYTVFALTNQTHDPKLSANVMGAVTGGRMILICFMNGSLTVRDINLKHFPDDQNWAEFHAALAATPPGNNGAFMVPFFRPEITPNTRNQAVVRYLGGLDETDGNACVRAGVEGLFLNVAYQLRQMIGSARTIRVTGGASVDAAMLQVIADVLNATLELMEQPGSGAIVTDSVSLGGALRGAAAQGWTFEELTAKFCSPKGERITPKNAAAYTNLHSQFEGALAGIL